MKKLIKLVLLPGLKKASEALSLAGLLVTDVKFSELLDFFYPSTKSI